MIVYVSAVKNRMENISFVIHPRIHIIFNCTNFKVPRIKQDLNIPIPEYQFWPFTPRIYTIDITEKNIYNLYFAGQKALRIRFLWKRVQKTERVM